jgi:hypothetical protein
LSRTLARRAAFLEFAAGPDRRAPILAGAPRADHGGMLRRILLAASAAALILPAAASANDFCVAAPDGCGGTSAPASGLAEVLATAESNGTADRVFLGKMDLIGRR